VDFTLFARELNFRFTALQKDTLGSAGRTVNFEAVRMWVFREGKLMACCAHVLPAGLWRKRRSGVHIGTSAKYTARITRCAGYMMNFTK
jgi:hypothetical protein